MWPVINQLLSLVEITTSRQESKFCKGFFWKNKFSTNESTQFITGHMIYSLYLNLTDDNH